MSAGFLDFCAEGVFVEEGTKAITVIEADLEGEWVWMCFFRSDGDSRDLVGEKGFDFLHYELIEHFMTIINQLDA